MAKPIIGLVGGIGSGKSVVAGMLKSLGCGVVDADKLAHEFLEDVVETIRKDDLDQHLVSPWWGDSVVTDGVPNRKEIAEIVFADATELKRLEDLLYPLIAARQKVMIAEYEADDAIRAVVLDAPKLYEAGVDKICDAVIFVQTSREARVLRVKSRGWTESQLSKRESMQDSLAAKKASADYVVRNNADVGLLKFQVERVFLSILEDS